MSPLVRASTFCRQPAQQHTVQLRVVVTTDESSHGCFNSNNNNNGQVSWASPPTLARISHLAGHCVSLSCPATQRSVVTRLEVLGVCCDLVDNETDDGETDDGETDDGHAGAPCRIYMSVLTATNLGLDLTCAAAAVTNDKSHDNNMCVRALDGVAVGYLQTLGKGLAPAETATLQLLGRPLPVHHPRLLLNPKRTTWPEHGNDDNDDTLLPLPPTDTLLQRSRVLVVSSNSELYFYKVLQVEGDCHRPYLSDNSRNNIQEEEQQVWKGTATTRYRIVTTPAKSCPRLPPLWQTRHLIRSEQNQHQQSSEPPPHPTCAALVRALSSLPASATPAERVWHVVDHGDDTTTASLVRATADWMGRQCLVVSGLAWYAYCHQATCATAVSSSSNWTGSLVDKLAGLEAALKDAARHAPCIVFLKKVDQELSMHDKPLRQDEESRMWSLLIDHLSWSSNQQDDDDEGDYLADCCRQVPPVLVVLSSAKPLTPGPLSQGLVYDSIQCSLPDQRYIRYLWKQQTTTSPRQPVWPDVAWVQHLLTGRSAGEVVALRDELYAELALNVATGDNLGTFEDAVVATLEALCIQRDEKRRKKSGLGRIPSVKWQDIGGLAHVRREIMDAIELPLQYPRLFPKSTRSGILLYGPPGCGKTLVAKAVATECGLPFLSIKGPELLGSYVGESEAHVRHVFEQARELAKQNKPPACVLFFDELDSLAPRRGESASGGNVMDRVVATFFTELDKDDSGDCSVFVLGATNRPDLLDPSLLRPGRFDRLVYLGVSSSPEDRTRILAAQIRKLRLAGDAHELAASVVQHLPENLTGADLSTVASGAQLLATERLCALADAQLEEERQRQNSSEGGEAMTMDQILESSDDDRLKPIVTLDDLLKASQSVVPSVSASELERYECLRDQFRR